MKAEFPYPCCRCGYCCLAETCPAGQFFFGVGRYALCPGLSFQDQAVCQIVLIDLEIIGGGAGCCIKARAVKSDRVCDFASLPADMKKELAQILRRRKAA